MSAEVRAGARSPVGSDAWFRFARAFVHEVRSPLNALMIYLELLGRDDAETKSRGTLAGRSRDQALRIEEYLKTFLVLWAAPSDGDADLGEIVGAALVVAAHECRRCGCTIESTVAGSVRVPLAPARLADWIVQMLSCVVVPGQSVHVALEADGTEARLLVRARNASFDLPALGLGHVESSAEGLTLTLPLAKGS